MTSYVRVREGKWEYSIPESRLPDEAPEGFEVLDKSPFAPSGKLAPPIPVTPLGTPAAGSKQERQRAAKTSGANSPGKNAGQTSATPEEEK
jgi:hypothetical protein